MDTLLVEKSVVKTQDQCSPAHIFTEEKKHTTQESNKHKKLRKH